MSSTAPSEPAGPGRNARLALILFGVFALMVGAAFASVPLYRLFCQVTGFGGTTGKAIAAPTRVLDQTVQVRFDSNVRGLPWEFRPDETSQTVRIGATGLAFFRVTNKGDRPMTGHATFNVVPEQAGAYFQKLQCFCFTDQTLQPGQTMEFPVVYFIDPGYADDVETKGKGEVTLSYTFFPSAQQQAQASEVNETSASKPSSASPPLGGSAAARL